MERRELRLETYDDVLDELDRLEREGYRQLGNWTLGQICSHLCYYMRGSLEGFDKMLPWGIRKTIGRPLLKKFMRDRGTPVGGRTLPASVPAPEVQEQTALAEARALIERLKSSPGPLHPSPLFDQLTTEQWRDLHVLHAEHHLRFLLPAETTA